MDGAMESEAVIKKYSERLVVRAMQPFFLKKNPLS